MRIQGRAWTIGLTIALVLLAAGAAANRRREPRPVSKPPRAEITSTPIGSVSVSEQPEPKAEPTPIPAPPLVDGVREVDTNPGGSLSGQVTSPEGPLSGALVKVEWVAAVRPTPEEALRLRRGGARRDRSGVWWWTVRAATDEAGFFSIDGLPALPLKVSAGGQEQNVRPGQSILLRTGSF